MSISQRRLTQPYPYRTRIASRTTSRITRLGNTAATTHRHVLLATPTAGLASAQPSTDTDSVPTVGNTLYRRSCATQRRQKQNSNPLPTLRHPPTSAETGRKPSTDADAHLTVGIRFCRHSHTTQRRQKQEYPLTGAILVMRSSARKHWTEGTTWSGRRFCSPDRARSSDTGDETGRSRFSSAHV